MLRTPQNSLDVSRLKFDGDEFTARQPRPVGTVWGPSTPVPGRRPRRVTCSPAHFARDIPLLGHSAVVTPRRTRISPRRENGCNFDPRRKVTCAPASNCALPVNLAGVLGANRRVWRRPRVTHPSASSARSPALAWPTARQWIHGQKTDQELGPDEQLFSRMGA
jgi:hypothetical protein